MSAEHYIRRYTSQNDNSEYGYPHSNALVLFFLQRDCEKIVCCTYSQWLPAALTHLQVNENLGMLHNDVVLLTVHRSIYCRKMILSNQTLCYICKCIRICLYWIDMATHSLNRVHLVPYFVYEPTRSTKSLCAAHILGYPGYDNTLKRFVICIECQIFFQNVQRNHF